MNRLLTLVLGLLCTLTVFSQENKPIAVVELFTSEGCSSCPSADRLLSAYIENPPENVELIGLSYHVDYWDYIGWKDPFASKEFSNRQREYARAFNNSSVYTPQMIVNGKYEFVGSNERALRSSLDNLNAGEQQNAIKIEKAGIRKNYLDVKFDVKQQEKGSIYHIALVEKGLSRKVGRGENRGKTLYHDNVVRAYTKVEKPGIHQLKLPDEYDRGSISVVVYSQDISSMKIISADIKAIDQ